MEKDTPLDLEGITYITTPPAVPRVIDMSAMSDAEARGATVTAAFARMKNARGQPLAPGGPPTGKTISNFSISW